MSHRFVPSTNALAIATVAAALLLPAIISGQTPSPAKKAWTLSRTPDGQPDLQGYWTSATYTPLERAAGVTKQFYTKEEAEEAARRAAARDEQQTTPGTTGDVHYDFTQFGLDKSQNPVVPDLRTAMITDPADGRIPALTAEAQKRARDRAAAVKVPGALYDSVQTIAVGSRCIIANPGPPMLPQGYNGNYQIVQSPGYVMILIEQIGDVRIIPLDGRPAPPQNIREWMGVSRGHWDGDTLVVETTNFNERTEGRSRALKLEGIGENFKLVERFRRTDENTFSYEFTINDPATFVKPWTAQLPFAKIQGPIFEPACHEGNYGIADTLAGARAEEKRAAEAAAKKAGQ